MWQIISEILIYYICAIISVVGVYLFGKTVLDKKINISNKKFFVVLQLVYIAHIIIYLKLTGLSKTIIMYVVDVMLYKHIFKISNKKSILLMFMYTIMLIFADLLSLFFLTSVLGINKTYYYEKIAGSIFGNVVVCAILIAITYLLKKLLQKIINNKVDNNTKVVTLSFMTLISILLFFYTMIKEFRISDNIVMYLIAIFVMIIVLFNLIKQTIQNNKLLQEYDNLLEIMVTFENEIEKQRVLRHETKNEFRTIRAKICDKQENKEIIEYIDEIVNDKYEVNKEKYAKFGYLPANGIKGLCYFKMQEAEDKGINISINISKKVKASTVYNLTVKEQRDFGRILGVFLDNAIEASAESERKQLGIEAYANNDKEFKLIISNTYNNEIDKTNSVIKNLKKNAEKQSKGVTTVFSKLKNGIVALGIGKVIKDSIQSGMEAVESDNLFSVSLGKHAQEVYDWSTEVSNALGLNAVEIRKNTGVIYNMTPGAVRTRQKRALEKLRAILA